MKPLFISSIAGIVIYILFAACYGLLPINWGETQKGVFIAAEIILPGMMLFVLTMNAQDESTIKRLERISEDMDKTIDKYKNKAQ